MPSSMSDMKRVIHSLNKIMGDESISTDDLIMELYKLRPLDLAMLKAMGNDEVQKRLNSPELVPFWVNKFNKLRLERNHSFQFRDQAPQSEADFYCGYVLYLVALKEKQKTEDSDYNKYLTLSMTTFNCFYAAQEILTHAIVNCKNELKRENLDKLYDYITKQESQIQQFKTPGCLLLANTYFYLAGFYQRLNHKRESAECYRVCWEQLHLAQLLETSSEREIHNAYFEQGLAASNVFKLNSISEIKDRFLELALEALPEPIRNATQAKAEKIFCDKFSVHMDDELIRPKL